MIEAETFRELVLEHQSMVYSIALRLLGDPGTAEEVAQDTFVALYRSPSPPAGADHLRFWLRRATTHGALDALRKRKRQPEHRAEEWQEQEHGAADWGDGSHDAAPVLQGEVELLLQTLPEAQRAALVLRYGEDLRPDEIATLLEQPVATVKSNLQRGLKLLRRKAALRLKEYVRGT